MNKLRFTFSAIFIIVGLCLILFPKFDIAISDFFYTPDKGFLYKDNVFVSFIFRFIPVISKICASLFILILTFKILIYRDMGRIIQSPIIFLLIALIIGPGLVVNYGFKENIGRSRPRDIKEFGGGRVFSRPLELANQCETNCSFSSGHAAMGYYFTSFSWIVGFFLQNSIFLVSFIFGSMVGLGRIMQGGHFFSDVIFSFVIIMITNEISYRLWNYLKNWFNKKDADRK